jgi:hypothetical protein
MLFEVPGNLIAFTDTQTVPSPIRSRIMVLALRTPATRPAPRGGVPGMKMVVHTSTSLPRGMPRSTANVTPG